MENKIREIRKKMGLTADELAEKVGVHKNTLLHWERGDNDITSKKLVLLAHALSCSVNDILGLTGD